MLLAIDTATSIAGLALYDEAGLHWEQLWETRGNHTVELMPFIVHACEQQSITPNDLRAVAISLGPGSFTGLRVGMSVAKGLSLAQRIPIVGVSTLDATAYAHRGRDMPICAVLRAGRGRYAVAFYDGATGERQGEDLLATAEQLAASFQGRTLICGEVDALLAAILANQAGAGALVVSPALRTRRAGSLAELAWQRFTCGDVDDLVSLSPRYLKTG